MDLGLDAVESHLRFEDSSVLDNYIVPGLTSHLYAGYKVRAFKSDRLVQLGDIAPHSHRYDFMCCVLAGRVTNTIWLPTETTNGDIFTVTHLTYAGSPGQYTKQQAGTYRYAPRITTYLPGQWYGMDAYEIHSIRFEGRAHVLFLEGPTQLDKTVMLEPFEADMTVPIGETQSWMFKEGR